MFPPFISRSLYSRFTPSAFLRPLLRKPIELFCFYRLLRRLKDLAILNISASDLLSRAAMLCSSTTNQQSQNRNLRTPVNTQTSRLVGFLRLSSTIAEAGGGARWVCHLKSLISLKSFRSSQHKSPLFDWKISYLIVGKMMLEKWYVPNETTYTILVEGIAHEGEMDIAGEVLRELHSKHVLTQNTVKLLRSTSTLALQRS